MGFLYVMWDFNGIFIMKWLVGGLEHGCYFPQ
jgi:hypothetical protein